MDRLKAPRLPWQPQPLAHRRLAQIPKPAEKPIEAPRPVEESPVQPSAIPADHPLEKGR